MSLTTTTHLNFAGDAREALDFYAAVFGGQVVAVPYGDAAETPEQADQIIWGQVAAPNGVRVMAYDVQASLPFDRGANPFYVSLQSEDRDEIQRAWDGLAEGADIQVPIGPSMFSPHYGKLADRFGVVWIISVVEPWNG